jgi:hypothetical protein
MKLKLHPLLQLHPQLNLLLKQLPPRPAQLRLLQHSLLLRSPSETLNPSAGWQLMEMFMTSQGGFDNIVAGKQRSDPSAGLMEPTNF